jgi:hypothetical protein
VIVIIYTNMKKVSLKLTLNLRRKQKKDSKMNNVPTLY